MFDLFKGATRPPMIFGVPTTSALVAFVIFGMLSLLVSQIMWLLFPIIMFAMSLYSKKDERAFRQIGLYVDTKLRCRRSVKKFWGATSYTAVKKTRTRDRY